MFEIFNSQIEELLPLIRNASFIEENHDLIMRCIDRMEIVLNGFYFESFLELDDIYTSFSITGKTNPVNKVILFIENERDY